MGVEPEINHTLLRKMCRARLPWPSDEHISPPAIMREFFGDGHFGTVASIAWPALKALSSYGPHAVPDVMCYLPAPESPEFPELAFGLHVLLDQAPRVLFAGIDARWTAWFDRVTKKFYGALMDLPANQQPFFRERWAGVSFEYWMCVASTWGTPLVHSESVLDHELAVAKTEALRCAIEQYTGKRDPARDDEELKKDIYAFPRIVLDAD